MPTLVGTSRSTAAQGTTASVALHRDAARGHLVVVALALLSAARASPPDASWREILTRTDTPDDDSRLTLWAWIHDGSAGPFVFTYGGSNIFRWYRTIAISDYSATTPIDSSGSATAQSSRSVGAGSLTPGVDDCLLAYFGAPFGSATSAWTPPSGMTSQDAVADSIFLATEQLVDGAGDSTGAKTGAISAASDNIGALIAIAPTDAVSPPTVQTQWCGVPSDDAVEAVATLSDGARGRLVVSTRSDLSSPVIGDEKTVSAEGVLRVSASGLGPDTHYHYGFEVDGDLLATGRGEFRTAPTGAASYTFCFGSCWHRGAFETPVWGRILADAPAFMLQLGDFGYPDDFGSNSVADLRTNYDEIQTRPNIAALLPEVPLCYVFDDHDSGGDGAWSGSAAMANAQQVFRERVPGGLPDDAGVYRTWVWGRCRFIVLDCRSHRDVETDTDDASKTMLGAEQIAWLADVLGAATEPVIFVISSVTWNDDPRTTDDAWGAYTTEQRALIASWGSLGVLDRMVMLCGDAHMLAADDGSNSPGGIPTMHGSPIAATGSRKGGTFSEGTFVGNEQYGRVSVTDDGETITVRYEGIDDAGSVAVELATVFSQEIVVPVLPDRAARVPDRRPDREPERIPGVA